MQRKIILLGSGGHANVVKATLKALCLEIFAVFNADNEDNVFSFSPKDVVLINAIGSTCNTILREKIYQKFNQSGYEFLTIVHPKSIVDDSVILGQGVQVMAGSILQVGVEIGDNCIINTGASIDHNCIIKSHVHIAPGVTLSGGCKIEQGVHIGTGATIIQKIAVGTKGIVAAGSVVIRDVEDNTTVLGVPAKVRE